MYHAKKSGDGVHMFDYRTDRVDTSRLQICSEVEDALETGALRLWFQPIIELGSQQIEGVEGLLRWQHPVHGSMSPAQFLHVVEISRHRKRLCREVIRQGAAFVAKARDSGHDLRVSVNTTIRDLLDASFPALVESALDEHGIDADRIVLEITERDLMDDRTGFEQAARAIRMLGVELSIDDFGTGQSSLLRLHWLPVTELKIDLGFVQALGSDPEADIIVRSIVQLGQALGHRVVAEGIETARQLAQLRALRCTHGQGYLFSAAMPPDDVLAMLGAKNVLASSA